MNEMKVDFVSNTIIITKAFRDAANEFGSEEYVKLSRVQQEHPNMQIVLRSVRTGNRKSDYKGLTYRYMRKFISIMDEKNLPVFEKTILFYENMYKENAKVYMNVRDWFLLNYPNHNKLLIEAAPKAVTEIETAVAA